MQLNADEGDTSFDRTDDYVTRKLNLTFDIVRLLHQPRPVVADVHRAMREVCTEPRESLSQLRLPLSSVHTL